MSDDEPVSPAQTEDPQIKAEGTPNQPISLDYKEINPFGDVRLTGNAGDDTCDYRVSSHQLMAASPFFRQLLRPDSPFQEAAAFRTHRKLEPFNLTITLDDHLLSTCEGVLRVLHSQDTGRKLTGGLSKLEDLYDLVHLADYFDCRAAMAPWVSLAMPKFSKGYNRPLNELNKWLHLAFVFRQKSVEKLSEYCITHGRKQKEDSSFQVYESRTNTPIVLTLLSGKIYDEFARAGGEVATSIYNIMTKKLKSYCFKNGEAQYCPQRKRSCTSTSVGLLSSFLLLYNLEDWAMEHGVWGWNIAGVVTVLGVYRDMNSGLFSSSRELGVAHINCDGMDALEKEVLAVYQNIVRFKVEDFDK